ncbi:tyrosine-protein phosphatase non-receptor type substrate 1-like [Cyrtonyx montezumae]|uniref:tyrosine-protein phosphatase non-receptor type substrate 1-like n=1 Tax=Cyrtonyx montezumae TaxID=9017 RepID=UPI0032DABE6B
MARLLGGQLSFFLAWLWAGTRRAVPSLLSSAPAVLLLSPGAGAQERWKFRLQQPEGRVWVTTGQTLTLTCTVPGSGPVGPVKWLKGWGSTNQTVYDQKGSSHRVTRAVNESNTDFTIRIEDVCPEDAGTYYCVKFNKTNLGNEVFTRGQGTEVLVHESSPFPSMEVTAAVLCFILLIFILAFCLYRRKQRGEEQSQHVAEVTTGSCLPFPVPCCAKTPSEVQDAENPVLPHQQSSDVNKDIHYADLQPLPTARWPNRSPDAERSEYASIRGAAK